MHQQIVCQGPAVSLRSRSTFSSFCPLVPQQDVWCEDQDHQRLPGRGGQFHPVPPSDVPLRVPSDRPTRVHTRPGGLHPDSDCGGQSSGRGRAIWGHVPGNRWDAHLSPQLSLVIPYLTSRWQKITMSRCQPESQFADAVMFLCFFFSIDKSKVALESCSNRYCCTVSTFCWRSLTVSSSSLFHWIWKYLITHTWLVYIIHFWMKNACGVFFCLIPSQSTLLPPRSLS